MQPWQHADDPCSAKLIISASCTTDTLAPSFYPVGKHSWDSLRSFWFYFRRACGGSTALLAKERWQTQRIINNTSVFLLEKKSDQANYIWSTGDIFRVTQWLRYRRSTKKDYTFKLGSFLKFLHWQWQWSTSQRKNCFSTSSVEHAPFKARGAHSYGWAEQIKRWSYWVQSAGRVLVLE